MASRPNVKSKQDNPPEGGYPKIPYRRDLRPRGPPNKFIWAAILTATAYGFYQIGQANIVRRQARNQAREARMAILPYLQHELDVKYHEEIEARKAKEAEVTKNDPEWKVAAPRFSKRWSDSTVEF